MMTLFLNLWKALKKNKVRYILVGWICYQLSRVQRHTGDIDLYIDDTTDNRKRLRKSFRELEMVIMNQLKEAICAGWVDFQMNNGVR